MIKLENLLIICYLLLFVACKRNEAISPEPKADTSKIDTPKTPTTPLPPTIPPVVVEPQIDKSMLVGVWKLVVRKLPVIYDYLYVRDNSELFLDNDSPIIGDLTGNWQWLSKDSLELRGSKVLVKKLTQDSFIFQYGNGVAKHVKMPIPESNYSISTITDLLTINTVNDLIEDKQGNLLFIINGRYILKYIKSTGEIQPVFGRYHGTVYIDECLEAEKLALDENNNLYVGSEYGIYQVSLSLKKATKILEGTEASFSWLSDLAVNKSGDVFFTRTPHIKKLDLSTKIVSTLIGNSNIYLPYAPNPSSPDGLSIQPLSMAFDKEGNLFFSDYRYGSFWKYSENNNNIVRVAGNGTRATSADGVNVLEASFDNPIGLSLDQDGNIYFSDNFKVRRITRDGLLTSIAGIGIKGYNGEWENAMSATLTFPRCFIPQPNGDIIFLDGSKIRKLTPKR